jgi:hypothetical protein
MGATLRCSGGPTPRTRTATGRPTRSSPGSSRAGTTPRGRGVGTRAVGLAARRACAALGAERVEARTDPESLPSQRLLAAAGFTREGVERGSRVIKGRRRDMVCWSLLPAGVGVAPLPA